MIWFIIGIVLLCAIAAVTGWVGGAGASRNALFHALFERDAACAERDRALERIATYGGVIEAYEEKIRKLKDEAQVVISDLEVQIVERDAVIARQRKQLSETVYEIKPNIVVDVATDPPKEVVYEVKTPKRPRKATAKASNTAGSEAAS